MYYYFIGKNFYKTSNLFIKDIDRENEKLQFTNNIHEALKYDSGWSCEMEKEWIKFHFQDIYPQEINGLIHDEIDIDEYEDEVEDD